MLAKSLLLTISLLALEVSAFWRMPCKGRLTMDRLDPIDTPGAPAHHAHAIHGGDGLAQSCTNDELRKSTCTSCAITQDKSGYWTPNLYWESPEGYLQSLEQIGGMLVYYLLRGENIQPFPEDLRIIAGDGRLRDFSWDDSLTRTEYAGAGLSDNQKFLGQKAIGFNCLDYDKHPEGALSVNKIPQGADCPNGLRTELFFPSCWDGVHSDNATDHKSHMAYPSVMDDGVCPESHPVRVPSLFYETIWNISAVAGRGGRLVFSNGDPTGYGYHGDFMNGWDQTVLETALTTCTDMSGEIELCEVFKLQSDDKAEQCTKPDGHRVVGDKLPALPGCNTINEGPEYAAKGGCPHDHGNSTMPSSSLKPEPTPTPMPTYAEPTPVPTYGAPAKEPVYGEPAKEPTYGEIPKKPKESKPEIEYPPSAPASSTCPDDNDPYVVVVTVTKTYNQKRAAETGVQAKRHLMQHLHKRHGRKF